MKSISTDILIVGAGPVGLMCAYLAKRCGLSTIIIDKSTGPIEVGRADALNARTLQLLELVDLFSELYPLGKTCNTSSVWANGKFSSRQSKWWDKLEGCQHKHFLMLGQSHIEKLLDNKLKQMNNGVMRSTSVENIAIEADTCLTMLSNGQQIKSQYLIGADGSRSFVREHFNIKFEITRPQIIWAVIDGIIETDFPKVPEIIVFQAETSDVAWIPREGNIDRFYIRMDTKDFTLEEVLFKINRAIKPHRLHFNEILWFSQFSVKESVAEHFCIHDRIFLAGDACHIHSVNGGQGLNTGLGDAFNLIWKLNAVIHRQAPKTLLDSYETERKAVAKSIVETSGALVRSTKFSEKGTHAEDYVTIVEQHAGNITGMGIRYGSHQLVGSRLYDFEIVKHGIKTRIYSLLDYTSFTLLIFGEETPSINNNIYKNIIRIHHQEHPTDYWTDSSPYYNQVILVRPDGYIGSVDNVFYKKYI